MVSPEVFRKAALGDLTAIQNWLEQGGNPNEGIERVIQDMAPCGLAMGEMVSHKPGSTLLMAAASHGKLDVVRRLVALLRVRLLLARGRARHGPETTVVAARLFGSLNGFADVPDPCFWRVVEYAWLGDWRHP